ncbi:MAG: UDP-N-acetylmuramoyl-L-alanyl-D-glutamate--2, 6-diaminopimelate ligase [Candidatus Westeberhardia cardiocondylae]|nr:UDP-N-acetylmuramoyl-L-alanyl-D-glutamate--2, 6-diaminopimelate ligase [Candidatus Westeberhardia cardiocondylae]
MINNNLHILLKPWIQHAPNIILNNIVSDNRNAMGQDLLVTLPGNITNGRYYIFQAIQQNISAIITEKKKKNGNIEIFNNIPIIYFPSITKNLSKLAGRFYKNPSHSLHLTGITGTNGKTTISHLLSQWATLLGTKSAIMGTIGNGIINHHIYPTKNTTDSAIHIQKFLYKIKKLGINFVSLEISSHALAQYRVENLFFQVAIFTNLSHEHLDYHKNMLHYEQTKWKLFSKLKVKKYIINANDKIGQKWLLKLQSKKHQNITTAVSSHYIPSFFSIWKGKWLYAHNIQYYSNKTCIFFKSSWGNATIYSPLLGKYNVDNILLIISTLLEYKYSLSQLIHTVNKLKPIPGRMETFNIQNKPKIIIDYAHNPRALKETLQNLRYHCTGKIWCIFGCGGNRDKYKRSIMGNISEKYSDNVIITDDNPRNETPKKIIQEIIHGIHNTKKIQIIHNRKKAIEKTIQSASPNDLILIAGKGHETYQIIGNKYQPYSDSNTVKKLLGIKYHDSMYTLYNT